MEYLKFRASKYNNKNQIQTRWNVLYLIISTNYTP